MVTYGRAKLYILNILPYEKYKEKLEIQNISDKNTTLSVPGILSFAEAAVAMTPAQWTVLAACSVTLVLVQQLLVLLFGVVVLARPAEPAVAGLAKPAVVGLVRPAVVGLVKPAAAAVRVRPAVPVAAVESWPVELVVAAAGPASTKE